MASTRFFTKENRTRTEKRAAIAGEIVSVTGLLQSGAWFAALTKASEDVYNYFITNMPKLFVITLILSIINWLAYAIKFASASNKNAGKLANLGYRTFNLLVGLSIGMAALFVSATLASTLFYLSCIVDPLVNLIQAVFFAVKSAMAENPAEKEFFRQKSMNAALLSIISGVLASLMIVLFAALPALLPLIAIPAVVVIAPYIPLVLGVISLVAVVALTAYSVWKLVSGIKGKSLLADHQDLPASRGDSLLPQAQLKNGFYSHSLVAELTHPESLKSQIKQLIADIQQQERQETTSIIKKHLWSENNKRRNKVASLLFLEKVLNAKESNDATNNQSLSIDGIHFVYKDKDELILKLDEYVSKNYSRAHQSFFKDKSRVTDCFNKAYQLILQNDAGSKNALSL